MPTKMTMRPKRVTACLNQSSLENQKYIDNGKTAVNNNKLILITRLTVTMMAYRKCKTSARYRSKLTAVIAKNDSKIKEDPTGYNTAPVMQYSGKLSVNTPIRCAENNGWTTAAVTKSDNARQNRCTEEGVCSEGVFEMAQRTRKFVVAPAKLDSMFTTTIAIVAETFAAGKFSGKITEQILTWMGSLFLVWSVKLPERFMVPFKGRYSSKKLLLQEKIIMETLTKVSPQGNCSLTSYKCIMV